MNKIYEIVIPVLFGIEAFVSEELQSFGYARDHISVFDGQVRLSLETEEDLRTAIAKLNFRLRCGERVLVKVAEFDCIDFDELFDLTVAEAWEDWIDPGFAIQIKGYTRNSALYSMPAIQRTLKKAIVTRLAKSWGYTNGLIPEDRSRGVDVLQFSLVNDRLCLMLDTSGESLHKRGYRPLNHPAPIRETLAAAILLCSRYPERLAEGEALWDPVCGSGTFLIEAALMQANIAPGLKRHFAGSRMKIAGKPVFDRERELCKREQITAELPLQIFGTDISSEAILHCRNNAERAGVSHLINMAVERIEELESERMHAASGCEKILIVANPPYGERLLDLREAEYILSVLSKLVFSSDGRLKNGLRFSLITEDNRFEHISGARADRRRKLYNGLIQCTLYHYFRHPKENSEEGKS